MGRIQDDLKVFSNYLPAKKKVIVFIDDLDRCDPKKSVEVLEAIKLLLELERFIIFLALDARIITQAIEEHYGNVLKDAEVTGYEYLDKIVQIPFSIPDPRPDDLVNYLGSLVRIPEDEIASLLPQPESVEEPQPTVIKEEPIISQTLSVEDAVEEENKYKPEDVSESQILVGDVDLLDGPPAILDEAVKASSVHFSQDEQRAFLLFHTYMTPNPRRIKRLANIYRLVRTLILNQDGISFVDVRNKPEMVIGWLILCEQWPYAAHLMMDIFDQNLRRTRFDRKLQMQLLEKSVVDYFNKIFTYIETADDQGLKKLDMKHARLQRFIYRFFGDVTLADVQNLRIFTVNFNPALSAEVRMALAKRD